MIQRIVLTGGPGAGKTVISRRIAEEFPEKFIRVPEAATQVYDRLQTRWDYLDLAGRCDVQRKIYQLQTLQEAELAEKHPNRILLLDRGTIDGAAYWPAGPPEYWRDIGTDHARELERYDAVIWLQTGAALGCYDGDASNCRRFEQPDAAIASGQLLAKLWGDHPKIFHIDAFPNVEKKIAAVRKTLEGILAGG